MLLWINMAVLRCRPAYIAVNDASLRLSVVSELHDRNTRLLVSCGLSRDQAVWAVRCSQICHKHQLHQSETKKSKFHVNLEFANPSGHEMCCRYYMKHVETHTKKKFRLQIITLKNTQLINQR
jgi:hypothetical protein